MTVICAGRPARRSGMTVANTATSALRRAGAPRFVMNIRKKFSTDCPDDLDYGGTAPSLSRMEDHLAGVPHCYCLQTRRTARRLTRVYDAALRDTGLKITQCTILFAIARGNETSEGALAERLGLERTTLVRNLQGLVAKGLLERVMKARCVEHSLTDSGRRALDEVLPIWRAVQARIKSRLAHRDAAVEQALQTLSMVVQTAAGRHEMAHGSRASV